MKATERQTNSQDELNKTLQVESLNRSEKIKAEQKYIQQNEKHLKNITTTSAAEAGRAASIKPIDEKFWKSDFGKFMRWLDLSGKSINPFANSAKSLTK